MLKRMIAVILLTSTLLIGCNFKLTPSRDPVILINVTDAAQLSDNLYFGMIASNNFTYSKYDPDYQYLDMKIDSILIIDQGRKHNKLIVDQDVQIQSIFREAWNYHKSHGRLTPGEAKIYRKYAAGIWRPRRISEEHLR